MTAQLVLVDVPVQARPLTARQRFVLDVAERAGTVGVTAQEAGAAWCERNGRHSAIDRCRWDESTGRDVLGALAARGLVRYRRATQATRGVWLHVDAVADAVPELPRGMTTEIPY